MFTPWGTTMADGFYLLQKQICLHHSQGLASHPSSSVPTTLLHVEIQHLPFIAFNSKPQTTILS